MSRRIARSSLAPSVVSSVPSKRTEPAGRLEQLQDAVAGGRLARAGLADEPERLALGDVEADAVDRLDVVDGRARTAPRACIGKCLCRSADREQRARRRGRSRARLLRRPRAARSLARMRRADEMAGADLAQLRRSRSRTVAEVAYGQRGAKRQAAGGSTRSGGRPGIAVRRPARMPSPSICGSAPSNASVYGCSGLVEQIVSAALLDDLAGVHDGDLVRRLGHHAHVVGDQDHRHLVLVAQVVEQVEHLRPARSRRARSSARRRSAAAAGTASAIAIITRWRMPPE